MSTHATKNTEVMHMSFDEKTGLVMRICPGMLYQLAHDLSFIVRQATNLMQQIVDERIGHREPAQPMESPPPAAAPAATKKKVPRRAR